MSGERIARAVVAASAPARICLAGESLDWMIQGSSVVAALPLRTIVNVVLGYTKRESVLFHAGDPINAVREVGMDDLAIYLGDPMDLLQASVNARNGHARTILAGSLIMSSTRVPVGAGVSSSAALAVAASAALMLAMDQTLPVVSAIARAAYAAEVSELHTGAGWMDFLACAYGGVNIVTAGHTPIVMPLREEIGCPVVLIDTVDRRATATTLINKHERFRSGDRKMRRYADTAPRIVADLASLLRAGEPDYATVGALLNEAQTLLRDEVMCSTGIIDECASRSVKAGAYGAKITGSGHGGCLFALCPIEAVPVVRAALSDLPVHVRLFTTGEPHGVVILPSGREGVGARPVETDQSL